MPENDVSNRVRAALPRGLVDRNAADIAAAEAMMVKIRSVYALYGFEAVETPFIEYAEALGKFLPDQDQPNEGVFSFKDDDDQWLSLRYDLTAPLARYVAENYDRLPKPYRSYRAGWVFRNEKPGPGRYRQFMQFDADTVGAASVAADAEICMMAADCLEALGIARGDYVIKVNNRKVLDGVMEAIGLGGPGNAGRRLVVLRAIDKLDRLGPEGVRLLLGEGRKDESGDFTKGAGLNAEVVGRLLDFLEPKFPMDLNVLQDGRRVHERSEEAENISDREIVRLVGSNSSTINSLEGLFGAARYREGLEELSQLAALTESAGFPQSAICIDPSVVRGLEYYTGPVFEAELTFENSGRRRQADPLRFGRRRRPVRRPRGAVPRGARPRDRLLDRRVAAARGVARDQKPDCRRGRGARPSRRAGPRPRRTIDGEHPAPRRPIARRRNRRRALSRRGRHERAAQIRRSARKPLRNHPGLERTRDAGRPAGGDP